MPSAPSFCISTLRFRTPRKTLLLYAAEFGGLFLGSRKQSMR